MKRLLPLIGLVILAGCGNSYTDPKGNFSLTPPAGWAPIASDDLIYSDTSMKGITFTAPKSVAGDTVLQEARIDVAAGEPVLCPDKGVETTLGGESARRWDWNEGAAGTLYAGTVVSAVHKGQCYRVTYFTISCNLGKDCMEGHRNLFDHQSLIPLFDKTVASFAF